MTLWILAGVLCAAFVAVAAWLARELMRTSCHERPHDIPNSLGEAIVHSAHGLPAERMLLSRDPVIAKLQLTRSQRQLILSRFDEAYTLTGVWADIKLEAFVDMIRNSRPSELIPVYYAQKRTVVTFAAGKGLPWLIDLIDRAEQPAPGFQPIPEQAS